METLHRSFLLSDLVARANEDGTPSNIFELSASSEFPVNRGRYTEILDHGPNSMRSTASSVLFNHNPDYLMGAVRSLASSGKRTSQASVEILPGATLPSGVSALDAVRSGALKGVSIGYRINAHTRTEAKDGTITIRATDWTINEISLTPIPADPTVGIGRNNDPDGAAFAALFDSETNNKDRAQMADPVIPALAPVAVVPTTDFRAEAKAIATQAEALGLRSADYVGLPAHEAQAAMLNAVAVSRKTEPVIKPHATVTADGDEKTVRHCLNLVEDGDFKRAVNVFNSRNGGENLEGEALVSAVYRGFSPGKDQGLFNMATVKRSIKAGKWEIDEAAVRAALVSSSFTMIAGLASAKLAFDGFSAYAPWSDAIIDRMQTGDFKAARTAALQLGDFSSPAEGSAFSDMTVGDAGGTGTLVMRGSGIELTKQAIYNDETDTFLRTIYKVGYSGAQHQDKLVATAVEASVFTAATAVNAFSQANLKTSWTNMMAVTGPSGEKPGYIPRKILVPTALYLTAVEATTVVGGSTIASPLAKGVTADGKFALEVVHGLHLSSATSWYMLADNMMNPAWTFLTHREYPIPQIFEVDAGLVASRKFRVEYPTVVITNHLNPGTNTKPVGAYKNT